MRRLAPSALPATEITFRPAEGGALAAYVVTCACGTRLGTSLGKAAARRLEGEHLAWHDEQAAREPAGPSGRTA